MHGRQCSGIFRMSHMSQDTTDWPKSLILDTRRIHVLLQVWFWNVMMSRFKQTMPKLFLVYYILINAEVPSNFWEFLYITLQFVQFRLCHRASRLKTSPQPCPASPLCQCWHFWWGKGGTNLQAIRTEKKLLSSFQVRYWGKHVPI